MKALARILLVVSAMACTHYQTSVRLECQSIVRDDKSNCQYNLGDAIDQRDPEAGSDYADCMALAHQDYLDCMTDLATACDDDGVSTGGHGH